MTITNSTSSTVWWYVYDGTDRYKVIAIQSGSLDAGASTPVDLGENTPFAVSFTTTSKIELAEGMVAADGTIELVGDSGGPGTYEARVSA
jgi:hypothetical protein